MRGKLAKQIRATARAMTPGRPEHLFRRRWGWEPINLEPGCTRHKYKQLKKSVLARKRTNQNTAA